MTNPSVLPLKSLSAIFAKDDSVLFRAFLASNSDFLPNASAPISESSSLGASWITALRDLNRNAAKMCLDVFLEKYTSGFKNLLPQMVHNALNVKSGLALFDMIVEAVPREDLFHKDIVPLLFSEGKFELGMSVLKDVFAGSMDMREKCQIFDGAFRKALFYNDAPLIKEMVDLHTNPSKISWAAAAERHIKNPSLSKDLVDILIQKAGPDDLLASLVWTWSVTALKQSDHQRIMFLSDTTTCQKIALNRALERASPRAAHQAVSTLSVAKELSQHLLAVPMVRLILAEQERNLLADEAAAVAVSDPRPAAPKKM